MCVWGKGGRRSYQHSSKQPEDVSNNLRHTCILHGVAFLWPTHPVVTMNYKLVDTHHATTLRWHHTCVGEQCTAYKPHSHAYYGHGIAAGPPSVLITLYQILPICIVCLSHEALNMSVCWGGRRRSCQHSSKQPEDVSNNLRHACILHGVAFLWPTHPVMIIALKSTY